MANWLIATSVSGSLITCFVFLFKRSLLKTLGGTGYYVVCALTLCFFLLPLQKLVPAAIHQNVLPPMNSASLELFLEQTAASLAADRFEPSIRDSVVHTVVNQAGFKWNAGLIIFLVWLCGFVLTLFYDFLSYLRFKNKVMSTNTIDTYRKLDIVTSEYVYSPILIGFFKPVIIVPDKPIEQENYRLAILHEWQHYKQKDAWIKLLAVVIRAVHWFNPAAYLMVANLAEACEYACDENVTRKMDMKGKKQYSEMILTFVSQAAPVLSDTLIRSKKQLFRRFELIMSTTARSRLYLGIVLMLVIILTSVYTSSVVFGEAKTIPSGSAESLKTYYNTSKSLEQNVRSTLRLLDPNTINMFVIDTPFYLDSNGFKVNSLNSTSPYYQISREWRLKDAALSQKTLTIGGEEVVVAFEQEAAKYKGDPVIDKMIRNQISFELTYKSNRGNYDHAQFVKALVKRGMIVVSKVTERSDFQFEIRMTTEGYQIGGKPLTEFDQVNRTATLFNKTVKLPEDTKGNQIKQLGQSFVMNIGETLAIDIKTTTDNLPEVSWSVIDVTTGRLAGEWLYGFSGNRYIFRPGKQSVNHQYKVVITGEQRGGAEADIEMFKFK